MVIRPPKGKKPYGGTPLTVDQSKGQISKLLREYGVEGVQWTDNFETGQVHLRFVVRDEGGAATAFDIKPAPFLEDHKTYDSKVGHMVTVTAPSWPRAMRALYVYLKAKLEAVAYGLTEVREEFLSQMVVRDAHGAETTAGELVLAELGRGGGRLAIEPPRSKVGAGEG